MNLEARAAYRQEPYGLAERLFQKVLDEQMKTLETDDGKTLDSMKNLADSIRRQGRYKEAQVLYDYLDEARVQRGKRPYGYSGGS